MYARIKKGNKTSEVYALNGLSPKQMMSDHNADEIHLVEKNGLYKNQSGTSVQKWRTRKIIQANPPTMKPEIPVFHRQIQNEQPGGLQMQYPSTIEAANVQIMYLTQQLAEAKTDKNRFQDKFEDYKSKFEKSDRELFELKQNHREELRNIEKESESGLNGFMEKNPELSMKAMEIFGPILADKIGSKSQTTKPQIQNEQRKELTDFIYFLQEVDPQDASFVNTCTMLGHLLSRGTHYKETTEFIYNQYNK